MNGAIKLLTENRSPHLVAGRDSKQPAAKRLHLRFRGYQDGRN